MNELAVNRCITKLIREKVSKKTEVAKVIADILGISIKAAYRRLNDEVMFTFIEIYTLASKLGFAITDIVPEERVTRKPRLIVPLAEKEKNVGKLLDLLSEIDRTIWTIAGYEDAEIGSISDILPCVLFSHNRELVRFSFYYSLYSHLLEKSYSDFCVSEIAGRLTDAIFELHKGYSKAGYFSFIMSRQPVRIMMDNLTYMKNIHAITHEEMDSLKVSIGMILDDLEQILQTGKWIDGSGKCDIYISDNLLNADLHYVWSSELSISTIQMYFLGRNVSFDREDNNDMRYWHELVRNRSRLISGCGLAERIAFIDEQRSWLNHTHIQEQINL